MASSSYQDEGGAIAEINVTPLVDVVLVLLVIFMVTAPMIAAQGIVVDSPQATTGVAVQSTLNMAITSDGILVVTVPKGEKRFAADKRRDAEPMLRAFHVEFPDSKAVIAGDKNISHGAVMEVIDMVRGVGIEKFALRTKVSPKKKDDRKGNEESDTIITP
ncbi:MAG: biopolymer transporter ExbD [Kofleriaceae bacterium]|nr:biopolymer transporter ExbD [Kofleriaceae bacterium]